MAAIEEQIGNKDDEGKLEWVLLPFKTLKPVIRVLMFGKTKYGKNNWMAVDRGDDRYLSAAFRHLTSYADGELIDNESGESHLAHAVCCLLFLLWRQE